MKKGRNQVTAAAHLVLPCKTGLDPEKKLQLGRSEGIQPCKVEVLLPGSIPKHITPSGEKYIIRFLELIHDHAVRGSSWNLSKVHACLVESESIRTDAYDMASFLTKCPVTACGDLMIGDSRRMRKILSPLIKQLGSSTDFNTSLLGIRERVHSAPASVRFGHRLSGESENTMADASNHKMIAASLEGFGSASSVNSYRDSLSTSSVSSVQGTLQCKWEDGLPHHVFSIEDKKDVYAASASKVESSDDKALDCVYTFYAGKRDSDARIREAIATMRVFTSITLCSSMEQIRETKFILYASTDDYNEGINLSDSSKNRLTKKMASVFRSGNFLKQRSLSRSSVKSPVLEDHAVADLFEEDQSSVQPAEKTDLPDHEIAAIVIRETCHGPAVADMGGWGIKFLKKPRNDPSPETTEPSETTRNNGACSTSMNVLIAAGIHGKSTGGGPSSLVERWASGGACDCGGWDIGCPLTVLVPNQRTPDDSTSEKCKPVHLFIQNSRQDAPALKMENTGGGAYSIHFQPTLSPLQSFAIAAAVIHSRNHELHRH